MLLGITPHLLFLLFAVTLIFFAYKVISSANPLHSALYLVLTMMGVAGAFFHLNAQFIAGVQVIVYAGAVMVLFVMVMMLFDLKHEIKAFTKGLFSNLLKLVSSALLAGYLIGIFFEGHQKLLPNESSREPVVPMETLSSHTNITKELSLLLYSKYLLAFEVLGILLLVVAVGAVVISRVHGGTHAKH